MKTFGLVVFLFAVPVLTFAQISDEGFEEWKVENGFEAPVGWAGSTYGVGRNGSANSGNYAASIWNWYNYALGWLVTGESAPNASFLKNAGIPVDFVPDRLTGFYRYKLGQRYSWSGEEDSAAVYVLVKRYNSELKDIDTISFVKHLLPPSAEWTPFSIDLPLFLPGTQPDSVVVAFYSSDPDNGATCGPDSNTCCYLSVDDVALQAPSGVSYDLRGSLTPMRISPNPVVNASARLTFDGEEGASYRLKIHDVSGVVVLKREIVAPEFDLSILDLPSGSYYASVVDDSNAPVAAGRFVVE